MNGAESLVATLVRGGVEVCFANPGTSEMEFVAALDRQTGMRGILGLFEGVATGAADGYARMAGKPACTLLHLGPGLANGLANLHNARRAHSPLVNIVGDHATYHRHLDAPLTSDIETLAAPMSDWVGVARSAADGAAALEAAITPPGGVATLIVPADVAWADEDVPVTPAKMPALAGPSGDRVRSVVKALRSGEPCAFLLGGREGVSQPALRFASQIAAKTTAKLFGDTFLAGISRGAGCVELARLPYFAEQAQEELSGIRHLIVVDTKAPISFFAYRGRASELTPAQCEVHTLSVAGEDAVAALQAVCEEVGATNFAPEVRGRVEEALPGGQLDANKIGRALATLLPNNAVVVNEANTCGFPIRPLLADAAPHEWLDLTGGAIGMGLPVATGAAVACPDRPVVALQADGSGMYTLQSLWTMARENLDVTVVVFSNRKYAILEIEFARVSATSPGTTATEMMDLSRPELSWVDLAKGMGVPGARVQDAESFCEQVTRGFATKGPYLIEAML
ncbi:MAG: acetolactate synthase-1/2/3 large subunit [Hyphomicrobiaceae bacterium]|jgi:acetolactate synthase-1/2/3 large subunit